MVVGRFKLDRLTSDEARMIAAQILGVVHDLIRHMRVIMKGEKTDPACHPLIVSFPFF